MVQQVQPATPHATSRNIQAVMAHLWRRRRMASAPPPASGQSGGQFAAAINAEFYRRGWPERYAWVTIGGRPEGGKQHVGGTPVNIGQGGEIKTGPASLKGKDIDRIDQDKQGDGAPTENRGAAPFDRSPIDHALKITGKASHSGATAEIVKHPEPGHGYAVKVTQNGKEEILAGPYEKSSWKDAHEAAVGALRQASESAAKVADQSAPTRQATMFPGIRPKPGMAKPSPGPEKQEALFETQGKPEKEKPSTNAEKPAETPAAPTAAHSTVKVDKKTGLWSGDALMTPSELKRDPARFQYKLDVDEKGVTKELKTVRKFNPDFAGRLLVWHDPKDGQNYVINGHHRHELAERTGYNEPLSVRFIDAKDEKEAKARGALANIAGGKGTALDAANFLRETGGSVEMMEKEGISLEGAIASNAVALSHLSDDLFKRLHSGLIREGRALSIARNLEDPARQDSLYRKITEKEKTRKNDYTDREVAEMAKKMSWAGSRTVEGADLFGSFAEEKDTFLEESELQSGLRANLSKSAKHFKNVASAGAQAILEEGGHNVLSGEFNAQQAAITKRLEDVFDIEARHRGPLTDAIKQAALELSDDPKRKPQIVRDLTARATAILREILGEGVSSDVPGDGEGPGKSGSGGEERESSAGLRSGGGSGGEGGTANPLREHFRRENDILRVVARYQRNHLLAWSDECLPDSPTAVARREEYAKKKPDAGRRDFGWDEKDHPRNEDGEFATKGERQSPEKNRENGPRTGLEKTMDTNKYHELGRAFAEKHGFVGKKDAARDLRAHGIEPTEATVTAWRRGAEPVADERREAERRRRLEFVETFVAEYVAELRAEHPDWTDDEIVEAAEPAAWEEHDRRREEELAESKARVWNRATDRLWAAGLVCCGVSAVSRSRYYGRDERADGRERIRLSDHSVAHACSDCAVCVEIGAGSPDADVVIGETADDAEIDEAISRAVELFGRRCPEEEEEAV